MIIKNDNTQRRISYSIRKDFDNAIITYSYRIGQHVGTITAPWVPCDGFGDAAGIRAHVATRLREMRAQLRHVIASFHKCTTVSNTKRMFDFFYKNLPAGEFVELRDVAHPSLIDDTDDPTLRSIADAMLATPNWADGDSDPVADLKRLSDAIEVRGSLTGTTRGVGAHPALGRLIHPAGVAVAAVAASDINRLVELAARHILLIQDESEDRREAALQCYNNLPDDLRDMIDAKELEISREEVTQ